MCSLNDLTGNSNSARANMITISPDPPVSPPNNNIAPFAAGFTREQIADRWSKLIWCLELRERAHVLRRSSTICLRIRTQDATLPLQDNKVMTHT